MIIVITGSSGRIGQELVDELAADHELRLIDRRRAANRSVVTANLGMPPSWFARNLARRRWPSWQRQLQVAGTLIHLAADPNPFQPAERVRSHRHPSTIKLGTARIGMTRGGANVIGSQKE